MCGRFKLYFFPDAEWEFEQLFGITLPRFEYPPILSDDMLPYNDITAIRTDRHNELSARSMFWNLIPYNSAEFKPTRTWFNTRLENLEQPYIKNLVTRRRCIIPVNSFLENKHVGGKPVFHSVKINGKSIRKKESYEFKDCEQSLIALGGIYDVWKGPDGVFSYSCSIITMDPNPLVAEIHERMPFILPKEIIKLWLDKGLDDFAFLSDLIKPYPEERLERGQLWPGMPMTTNLFDS
jgi:putative SOS response-associated peptidase YedK